MKTFYSQANEQWLYKWQQPLRQKCTVRPKKQIKKHIGMECGVWCVVCGVWCVVCGVCVISDVLRVQRCSLHVVFYELRAVSIVLYAYVSSLCSVVLCCIMFLWCVQYVKFRYGF